MIKVARGCLGSEELEEVKSAFEYGYFGLAFKVDEFEEALKSYFGASYVVATNTGTTALHLALDALGIGPGDEVIVPSFTYVASFQAISATGAKPVSCDIHQDTLLMDVGDVESRLSAKTKAVMPVHYAGNPCDMDALCELRDRHGFRIVEDAAHAFGSTYKAKKIGGFGDIVCFSFDSIKNITCGEGGAIICQDENLDKLLRNKRLLGIERASQTSSAWKERGWHYDVTQQGFRYHMSNINAAIGLAQLKKVDRFIARRREICRAYNNAFQEVSGIKKLPIDYNVVAPHIYVVKVLEGRRDDLSLFLKGRDIETGVAYIPNHFHAFYREEGLCLPETEKVFEEILTLPLHFEISDEDLRTVIDSVQDFFSA